MIIIRLQGGLGNQLFQYSLGKVLSHVSGHTLKFDVTSFAADELRKVEVLDFQVGMEIASRLEISHIRYGLGRHIIGKLTGTAPRPRPAYRRESSHRFDPEIAALKENAYLDGYWQSEQYFGEMAQLIREDLILKSPLSGEALRTSELLSGCESVSVHVRRGDYVSVPTTQGIFHSCDLEYYRKSVAFLAAERKDARFFIFSDDPAWVRANLLPELGVSAMCLPVSSGPAIDLTLMSCCRHHIIANSSFSWWGAWLNPRSDKIVLAPKNWFKDSRFDDADMIPTAWRRLF